MPKQTVVRCVALLLLLFAAVDLLGIDLFRPSLCASPSEGSADQDDCFCCCGHIVFKTAPQLSAVHSWPSDTPPLTVRFTSAERTSIYRPPRA
jgi:hypothetical protein